MTSSRRHQFVITVTFDRLCTQRDAIAAVRDCIHGEFYPTAWSERDPEVLKVRGFKPLPKTAGGRGHGDRT